MVEEEARRLGDWLKTARERLGDPACPKNKHKLPVRVFQNKTNVHREYVFTLKLKKKK